MCSRPAEPFRTINIDVIARESTGSPVLDSDAINHDLVSLTVREPLLSVGYEEFFLSA